MRLERVVQLRRRSIGRLDDRVGLLEGALGVAALVRPGFGYVAVALEPWRDVADGLLEIDHVGQRLVVDVD